MIRFEESEAQSEQSPLVAPGDVNWVAFTVISETEQIQSLKFGRPPHVQPGSARNAEGLPAAGQLRPAGIPHAKLP